MISQEAWEEFSSQTKYISKNFNRTEILQVICKCGLEGGLPFNEAWPRGVVDYPYKMRFRKCNNHRGAIYVFNDFCINNEPFSWLSVMYREYNASIFGKSYAEDADDYLQLALFEVTTAFNQQITTIIKKRSAFIEDYERKAARLQQIAESAMPHESKT